MASIAEDTTPCMVVVAHVRALLHGLPVSETYRDALAAALGLSRNILSDTPDARWARLVWTCCAAANETWRQAMPAAAAAELFMVGLDLLDDEEDGDESSLRADLGRARCLNVSTGLLFLAQQSLLRTAGPMVADRLLDAGLRACSGQHADLAPPSRRATSLDDALSVTMEKSASLAAALCRLGATCAGVDAAMQDQYARFGLYLGTAAQLANDLAAVQPNATGKTDIALARPTLPLTYAALADPEGGDDEDRATDVAVHLTWAVAETHRRRALDLIPRLTTAPADRAALADLLHIL